MGDYNYHYITVVNGYKPTIFSRVYGNWNWS